MTGTARPEAAVDDDANDNDVKDDANDADDDDDEGEKVLYA